MEISVVVDREACIGAQNCLFWAPGVFEIDDEGLAVVVGDLAATPRDQLLAAARECPTRAIHLSEPATENVAAAPNESSEGDPSDPPGG